MKKKQILITMQYMEIGGVERSLLGLLDAIDYSRFNVDLFVYRHSGDLMRFIPPQVNLLPEIKAYTTLARAISEILCEGYLNIAFGRLIAKQKAQRFGKKHSEGENHSIFQYVADATTDYLPKISDVEYDMAISFITPHNIVRDKVKARRKIAWIHTDYSNVVIDVRRELRVWESYDRIAAISDEAKKAFVSKFPSLAERVVVIENILSVSFVKEQALLEAPLLDGKIKLLTVGRFCYAKAFDRAVQICAKLVDQGLPIKWYAIGYGDEEPVRQAINEYAMQEHFIIIGKRDNPYPYMAACDIYIQPSRYEGKAVAVREAQILGRPVVITNFATSASQLEDGVDGLIVPMDIDKAADGIRLLIRNKALQKRLRHNTTLRDYGNTDSVNQLYDLI